MKNRRAGTHACIEGYIQGGFLCYWSFIFDFTCLKFPFRNVLSLLFFFFFYSSLKSLQGFAKEKGEKRLCCAHTFFLFLESAQGGRCSFLFLSLVALRFTSFVLRTLLFEILFFKSAGSKGWWAPASATAFGQRVFFLNNSLTVLLYFIFP